jgi:hypothetical protein
LTNEETSKFTALFEQAKDLKEQAATGTFKDVIQAMNMVDGYNYEEKYHCYYERCMTAPRTIIAILIHRR